MNLRILTEFQSRKAHCVQFKDKDVLRLLCFIIICIIGYLISWTLVDLDYFHKGYSFVIKTIAVNGENFSICQIKWWNYFIAIGKGYSKLKLNLFLFFSKLSWTGLCFNWNIFSLLYSFCTNWVPWKKAYCHHFLFGSIYFFFD